MALDDPERSSALYHPVPELNVRGLPFWRNGGRGQRLMARQKRLTILEVAFRAFRWSYAKAGRQNCRTFPKLLRISLESGVENGTYDRTVPRGSRPHRRRPSIGLPLDNAHRVGALYCDSLQYG